MKLLICRRSSPCRVLDLLCDHAELRWTHGKIQRLSTSGLRLEDVVTDPLRNIPLSLKLHMIKLVQWESKWYSRNNRRLWCFREAAVIAVQVRVGATDRAFLRGSTTCTDGLSLIFLHSCMCKVCGEELVNRTKLHNCQRKVDSLTPPGRARVQCHPYSTSDDGLHSHKDVGEEKASVAAFGPAPL